MVRSVERALSILESFAPGRTRQSLHEISNRTSLSKTTSFRLLETLVDRGFLVRDERQRYSISFKLLAISGLIDRRQSLHEAVRKPMSSLGNAVGETVALYTMFGQSRLCIETIEVQAPLMRVVRLGEEVPVTQGAIGRALLCQLEDEGLQAALGDARDKLQQSAFIENLTAIRDRGFEVGRSERVKGATAVAAPLFLRPEVHGPLCVAIVGPSIRIDDRTDEFAAKLLALARQLRSRLEGGAD